MKQYKLFVTALLIALATILVGCGDTGADATEAPTAAVEDVETPMDTDEEMDEEMDTEMESTEEADG